MASTWTWFNLEYGRSVEAHPRRRLERTERPRGGRELNSAFWNKTIISYNQVASQLLSLKWKKLRIEFARPCRHAHGIDLLIGGGTRRGVKELRLNFQNSTKKAYYRVPSLTFASATPKRLELNKCVLHLPTCFCSSSLFERAQALQRQIQFYDAQDSDFGLPGS